LRFVYLVHFILPVPNGGGLVKSVVRDRRWLAAAALFLVFQLAVTGALALNLDFAELPPFRKYANYASAPVLFFFAGSAARHLRTMPPQPVRHLALQDWKPAFLFAGAMGLVWLQFVCLTWAKAMIPLVTPMWADPLLANMEAALFGADAWRLLPAQNDVIDLAYLLWPLILCLAFVVTYFRGQPDREALLLSFFLSVGLLGTFGQYLLPSGGPIFWERLGHGPRFNDLVTSDHARRISDMLWIAYEERTVRFAAGISAFPSIHVATTMWLALALRHWAGWIYLGAIFAGSIMLGWHYSLDGIAGAIGAIGCYMLARKLIGSGLFGKQELVTEAA
jgi:hypothetical protein